MAIPKSIKAIDDLFYSSRNCKIEKINGIEKQPKSTRLLGTFDTYEREACLNFALPSSWRHNPVRSFTYNVQNQP
jgi:hypothetical protein